MSSQDFPSSAPNFLSDQNTENEETDNGLCLHNVYIPEEVILQILSFIEPKQILKYSLVCRKWNKLIKSNTLWTTIFKRKYNREVKKLPWYLYYGLLSTNYFDNNLVLNGNGQNQFDHWIITANGGDLFTIEDPPIGSDPLPDHVQEFNKKASCFATSYGDCCKTQNIILGTSKLFRHILDYYKPHIYLSEWTTARFDCGSIYILQLGFVGQHLLEDMSFNKPCALKQVEQWLGRKWEKIEMTVTSYPEGVEAVTFEHLGRDTQFWAGHYGSKMAGGVLKLLWDSVQPLPVDDSGTNQPKKFSKLEYTTNASSIKAERPRYQFLCYDARFLLNDEDEHAIHDNHSDSD